ncbi:MAG: TRAP transporter substrate-binding protein [Deltaproteobacteria bacterium]|jgi:TRAP-type C4-dicarboxylate transport system substrate-binding protein|nr:TRAP transporter substrate-binding protein [Deltaproteobacteria bacterium]MBW2520754.1 TRAP transporter substrate-binding protein [Deltaproteobacteria bacterium]
MQIFKSGLLVVLFSTIVIASTAVVAGAQDDPLASWQPKFDPSKAEYKYLLSCVGHPAIEGVGVGYRIRDKVWEKSGGRLFVDFRPLSLLGGEKDVIRKLKIGAIQGMMSSSVAAANISDTLGVVNLPYVVDTFEKLDRFRSAPELWQPFRDAALDDNIIVTDITGYGSYGWATNTPVRTLEEAKTINFRIAQAPVNLDFYKAWGLKFTVMPWPDVPQALQTGVITGLDHTPIVCNISNKFTVAKNYTQLDYAQGLYIHLINTRWLNKLPEDLRKILLDTIEEESAVARSLTRKQQADQIQAAKDSGVTFYRLSEEEKAELINKAKSMYDKWGEKIGAGYFQKVQSMLEN